MSEPLAPEDFPGPHGLPFVGNVRAIDLAHPIESLMSLAGEYGPIFKLTSPAGISVVVSGVDPGFGDLRRRSLRQGHHRRPVDLGRGPS
jgi:hypothetical protein